MIRASNVLGLMRAEARLTRRLVRFWVFQSLALIVGLFFFFQYALLHRFFSSWSASVGLLNPRFLLVIIGIYYLAIFLFGLVFLGYDIRARDKRERMNEVVDALPCTNIELMLGRFLGILVPAWLPVIFISIVLAVLGLVMGTPLEWRSLITFVFVLAIPAYAFALGLTFLLTILLRHRLIAAVVTIGVIVGIIVINFGFVPVYLLPAVDITGGFSVMGPSDIIPSIIDIRGFAQRAGVLLIGLGFLWLATAFHPRHDDSPRARTAAIGVVMLVLGACGPGILVWETLAVLDQKEDWSAAHTARNDDPLPDLLSITGSLDIRAGSRLDMDLALRLRAPAEAALSSALFSLNPGLTVETVTASGQPLEFEQELGLLDVKLAQPLAMGAETTLEMIIGGAPDFWFGYIDAVKDPLSVNIREGNMFMLGFLNMIFDKRYVALMPGVRWLPASGGEIGRGDPHARPSDFYELDLTVEVPEGWLVAGPGKRHAAAGGDAGRTRFRFAPPAPVPDVCLVGGRFESRSAEIDGVTVEALLHPRHQSNLEVFADAAGELRDWLSERLGEATDVGLAYPYDALTLVEVPGALRGYGGGWRMDTTLAQPAMVLTRESGFPTGRFDVRFEDPSKFEDQEGGLPRAKRETLERFFENDFSGGNPFIAASRSFFVYQTAAAGEMGLPLDYVNEDLSNRVVAEKQGYFSIHLYGTDINNTLNQTLTTFGSDKTSVADAMIQTVTSRTDVWDTVLEINLADLDPWAAPESTLNILALKGGAMARSMYDGLGKEKTGKFLATLREQTGGGSYTRDDVLAAGEAIGEDLTDWLDVWLDRTDLPGFTTGDLQLDRITDADDGTPRYQFTVMVRNEEPTPGMVRLRYRVEDSGDDWSETDPIRVAGPGAVRVGLVTSKPPHVVRVDPYLALNRKGFDLALPAVDDERIVEAEPLVGAEVVEWSPVETNEIIVDDLDEGFSIEDLATGTLLRVGAQVDDDEDTDGGLPVAPVGRPPTRWSRSDDARSYGKYRHTKAIIKAGKGERKAVFAAEIPRAGQWELEYYLARGRSEGQSRRRLGNWSITIVDETGSQQATLDADDGESGWNSLGIFELADGEVRVEVPDSSDGGRRVEADAIRWRPQSPQARVLESE